MQDHFRNQSNDTVLYGLLFLYSLCFLALGSSKGGIDAIRLPSFALLLLVLVQVLFPRFRFSKTANALAVLVIVGLGIIEPSFLMSAS
jgi:hypothetical protein